MSKTDYRYVIVIATSREQVWESLTNPEFTCKYWHSTRVRSDWRVGSPVVFLVAGENGDEVGCEGEILKAEAPVELSYTWAFPRNPETRNEPPSRVTFLLDAFGEHTRLTVVHDGFAEGSKMLEMVSPGWPLVLAGLKTLLETGEAVDFSAIAV